MCSVRPLCRDLPGEPLIILERRRRVSPSAVKLPCAVSYLYGHANSGRNVGGWVNMCWSLAWSATIWVMISVSSGEAFVRRGASLPVGSRRAKRLMEVVLLETAKL